MHKTNQPDRDSRHSEKIYSAVLIGIAYVLAVAGMFMLGCFVVGPWLSRTRSSAITAAPPVSSSVHPQRPSQPPDAPAPSLPKVTIPGPSPEIPEPPQAASPTPPTVPHNQVSSDSSSAEPQDDPNATAPTAIDDVDVGLSPHTGPSDMLHRVRAGAYTDRANADALSRKLTDAGFTPTIYRLERSNGSLYVVQVGAFASRENADDLARSLRQAGFAATISTED